MKKKLDIVANMNDSAWQENKFFKGWTVAEAFKEEENWSLHAITKKRRSLVAKVVVNQDDKAEFVRDFLAEVKLQSDFAAVDMGPQVMGWTVNRGHAIIVMEPVQQSLLDLILSDTTERSDTIVEEVRRLLAEACSRDIQKKKVTLGNIVVLQSGFLGFQIFSLATTEQEQCQTLGLWISFYLDVVRQLGRWHMFSSRVLAFLEEAFAQKGETPPQELLLDLDQQQETRLVSRYAGLKSDRKRNAMAEMQLQMETSDVFARMDNEQRLFFAPLVPLQNIIQSRNKDSPRNEEKGRKDSLQESLGSFESRKGWISESEDQDSAELTDEQLLRSLSMFQGWTIGRRLGKGGFGAVYKIRNKNQKLAVKIVRDDVLNEMEESAFVAAILFEAKHQMDFAAVHMAPQLRGWQVKNKVGILVMDRIQITLMDAMEELSEKALKRLPTQLNKLILRACRYALRQGDVNLDNVAILQDGHLGFIDFGRAVSGINKCQSSSSWIVMYFQAVQKLDQGHPFIEAARRQMVRAFKQDNVALPPQLRDKKMLTEEHFQQVLATYYFPYTGDTSKSQKRMIKNHAQLLQQMASEDDLELSTDDQELFASIMIMKDRIT